MSIFQDALNALPSGITEDVEKIRALCDTISSEEKEKIEAAFGGISSPKGPNIFLCLPCKARVKSESGALTLERELGNVFVTVLYTRGDGATFKKQKLWEIKEVRPDKILTEYAKIYKYLEGN